MTEVHVISGFLGAGKTTFIKKILKVFEDKKVVILENEFGEEAIDGDIIKEEGFDVVELEQGCICCSLKVNFIEGILNIVEKINPDHIIVEPTGLGLLSEIINIMNVQAIKEKCSLTSLITIIDSINYLGQLDSFGDFFQDQIKYASTLILSKTTEVNMDIIDEIVSSLRKQNPNAYIITEDWDNFSNETLKALLNGELNRDIENIQPRENYDLPCNINSVAIDVKSNISKDKLEGILKELSTGKFGEIVRGKGFINNKEGVLQFDYVGGKYIVNRSNTQKIDKACFIGKNLKKAEIQKFFE